MLKGYWTNPRVIATIGGYHLRSLSWTQPVSSNLVAAKQYGYQRNIALQAPRSSSSTLVTAYCYCQRTTLGKRCIPAWQHLSPALYSRESNLRFSSETLSIHDLARHQYLYLHRQRQATGSAFALSAVPHGRCVSVQCRGCRVGVWCGQERFGSQ